MTLLTPWGLLGLLGIAVLILIYIIKPNYQQKFISSTFVWKLSLKYTKKRYPTSKLRNILIFLCQLLAVVLCAGILAQPIQTIMARIDEPEVIAIIDSSASMRTKSHGESRFERAVNEVVDLAEDTFFKNGFVSVIIADNDCYFLASRVVSANKSQFKDNLLALLSDDTSCSYGTADINKAISLSEEVLKSNPSAKIYLYTDSSYPYVPEGITVVNVAQMGEWNAAILRAYTEIVDNYYTIVVDVACYGRDAQFALNIQVNDANAYEGIQSGRQISFSKTVPCDNDAVKRVIFTGGYIGAETDNITYFAIDNADRFFSYSSINVSINVQDSFKEDNNFDIYDGQKQVIKIQYYNPSANAFFNGILAVLQNVFVNRWDIRIDEVKSGQPAISGYDFYIFENIMPSSMPTDGIVFLIDPKTAPVNSGFRINGVYDFQRQSVPLSEEQEHPILNNVVADNITLSRYTRLDAYQEYDVLLSCAGYPALLLKDDGDSKVAVMTFSVHYSNIVISQEFPILLYNMFEYFLPSTVLGNSFEVNESIPLNSRSPELNVSRGTTTNIFTAFPAKLTVNIPGTYVLSQKTYFGKQITESIFIRIPVEESNIFQQGGSIASPPQPSKDVAYHEDLLIYVAAALVGILFIEWWLQSRQSM